MPFYSFCKRFLQFSIQHNRAFMLLYWTDKYGKRKSILFLSVLRKGWKVKYAKRPADLGQNCIPLLLCYEACPESKYTKVLNMYNLLIY